MKRTVRILLLAAVLGAGARTTAFAFDPISPDPLPVESAGAVLGGDDYFVCAATQVIKYFGLFTGNVGFIVAGAIAGGIACGMGW